MRLPGAILASLLALSGVARAETLAFVNGTVALGDGSGPIERGTVVVRDARVVAAGRDIAVPADARVIDATDKWVSPGLFAGFSRIGLAEAEGVDETNDIAAPNSPFSAALDASTAINPAASAIRVSRAAGITRAVVAPGIGKSIFAGQGAVIDLADHFTPVMQSRAFQFVELGMSAARVTGGRAANFTALRVALDEAIAMSKGRRLEGAVLNRADATALIPLVTGKSLLLAHVERAADILQVLQIKAEYKALRVVIVGASEAWRVADELKAAGVPVIASALVNMPDDFEKLASTQSNIGMLSRAGVSVSIGMIGDGEARQAQMIRQYAGNLVALLKIPGATGLSWGAAFAAITSGPALALGMEKELGSLQPGRRADVVLWSGDPLELSTAAERVWIDGVEQPLRTRQQMLHERYQDRSEEELPRAYTW